MAAGWQEVWARIDGLARFGILPGLERMEALLEALGHPEHHLHCIQVAGTNGKGATAHALATLLAGAGQGCGLYTSPHVVHPSERIRLNLEPLDESALLGAWSRLEPLLDDLRPSYFETLTALALVAFSQAGLRWAVLECGLGGRLDATSAVRPVFAILTSVGADHLDILGPGLQDVAWDKAHVAPPGGILLSAVEEGDLAQVIERVAQSRGSTVLRSSAVPPARVVREDGAQGLELAERGIRLRLPVDTRSWHEAGTLALQALRLLPGAESIPSSMMVEVDAARLPGRFQILRRDPPLVLDVAHNPPALERLVEEVGRRWPGLRFNLLLAGMADKDLAGNLRALSSIAAQVKVLVLPGHRRAADPAAWSSAATQAACTVDELDRAGFRALRQAVLAGPASGEAWADQALLVCGSFLSVAAWLGDDVLPPGL